MAQSLADDVRLRAAEAQMRRALGLQTAAPRSGDERRPTPATTAAHRPQRRFVRDGEVPVTVVNRDHNRDDASGINHLGPLRQALTEQTAARKYAERSLEQTQATIRELQTKLAHERLAKDEALRAAHRATGERQAAQQRLRAVQDELLGQRLARGSIEQEGDQVIHTTG